MAYNSARRFPEWPIVLLLITLQLRVHVDWSSPTNEVAENAAASWNTTFDEVDRVFPHVKGLAAATSTSACLAAAAGRPFAAAASLSRCSGPVWPSPAFFCCFFFFWPGFCGWSRLGAPLGR